MASPQLTRPTVRIVTAYTEWFDQESMYSVPDKALSQLFAVFPGNEHLEHVLLKVVAVNSLYKTNILGTRPVAEHIWKLQIDSKLDQNSPEVVDEIARTSIGGKPRHIYSFATKYCSWHKPEAYPIYDSFVGQLLVMYQKVDGFARFKQSELRDYMRYKEVIDQLRVFYGLVHISYKQLDKFLWLYGRGVELPNNGG